MIILETERLILRTLLPEDAEIMYDYRNDERCAKYQRGQTKDLPGIQALVKKRMTDIVSTDAPFMVAVALKDGAMIGEIVVMPNDGAISLGYTFHYAHHRKGYAFEALSALIPFLHEKFPEWEFICFAEPENIASRNLLQKLGYRDLGYIPQVESQMFGKWLPDLYHYLVKKTLVEKGWSGDKKYCAETADGSHYLLRITAPEKAERFHRCYMGMEQAAKLEIPMCLPVEFGTCPEGTYAIHTWIDGADAEALIPTLPPETQYTYGLDAGKILKKLHSLPAPEGVTPWAERFNSKIDRKLKMYADCPLKYENGQHFIDYIAKNRHLLSDRPQSYQHGDYHIGNMMVDKHGVLTVIDFDRDDFGDPWEEFNRIVWCAQASPLFASGMVDGYFDGSVPMEFWQLLALYISSNTLSSLPWAIPFGQAEIDTMIHQAEEVLQWYSDMSVCVPAWYAKP